MHAQCTKHAYMHAYTHSYSVIYVLHGYVTCSVAKLDAGYATG